MMHGDPMSLDMWLATQHTILARDVLEFPLDRHCRILPKPTLLLA
jgi:hypothetical protein